MPEVESGSGIRHLFIANRGEIAVRIVRGAAEVPAAFSGASAEAGAAFGDPTLFIERYIERARHVEFQSMVDAHGNVVHLGKRDCSIQRRHQEIMEEAPSAVIDVGLCARMSEAAVRRCGSCATSAT